MTLVELAAAAVALWGAGTGISHVAGLGPDSLAGLASFERRVVRVAISYLFGTAALMALGTLIGVAGLPIESWSLGAGLAVCGCLRLLPKRRASRDLRPTRASTVVTVSLIALIVIGCLWVWAGSVHPNSAWDSVAIWGTKARALIFGHRLHHPVFTDPAYRYLHQDYPIGVPLYEAWPSMLGMSVGRGAIGLLYLVPVSAAIVVLATLRDRAGPWRAASWWVVLLGLPVLQRNVGWGYADGIVASLAAAVAATAWRWLRTDEGGWAVTMAILAVALVHTKAEGTALLVAVGIGAAAHLLAHHQVRRSRTLVLVVAPALASLVPWALWVHGHHIPTSFVGGGNWRTLPHHVGDVPRVIRGAWHYVFLRRSFGLLVPAGIALGAIRVVVRAPERVFFLTTLAAGLVVFVAIVSLDASYLIRVSLDRNLLELSGVLAAWVGVAASDRHTDLPEGSKLRPMIDGDPLRVQR